MKSMFRVGSPTGTTGNQQIALSSLAGHPGVVQGFTLDAAFSARNAAAAVSLLTVRTGRGGLGTTVPITTAYPAIVTGASPVAFTMPFPEQPLGTTANDDIDNIVNALYGAAPQIFNLGVGRIIFDQLTMVQLRTLFGVLNGGMDFTSRNLIDYPINFPSSGSGVQAENLDIYIPISLTDYVAGGEVFAQGTDSMRDGAFQLSFGTNTSFVNVAGATINLTALVVTLFANYLWEGDGSWVGPTWRATRQAYGGNNPMLKPGHYIFISDSSTQTAATIGGAGINVCTVVQYNFHGQWNGDQITPAALRQDWILNRLKYGNQYDISERTVPIITVDPTDTVRRLPLAKMAQTVDASSGTVTNITLMIVEIIEKNPGIVSSVAAIKGGGGPVTEIHPPVLGHDSSEGVPQSMAAFYPSIAGAGAQPGGNVASSPGSAGQMTANRNLGSLSKAAQHRSGGK